MLSSQRAKPRSAAPAATNARVHCRSSSRTRRRRASRTKGDQDDTADDAHPRPGAQVAVLPPRDDASHPSPRWSHHHPRSPFGTILVHGCCDRAASSSTRASAEATSPRVRSTTSMFTEIASIPARTSSSAYSGWTEGACPQIDVCSPRLRAFGISCCR